MKTLSTLCGVVLLSACATIPEPDCTEPSGCKSIVISTPINSGVVGGVTYAIPKQLLEFSIKRDKITEKKLKEKLDKAKTKAVAAKTKVDEAKAVVKKLEQQLAKVTLEKNKATLELKREIALIDVTIANTAYRKANDAKAEAERRLASFSKEHFEDVITVKALSPVPSHRRFVAQKKRSAISSDTVEIKTTSSGLLSGGSGKSEGQLDDIFVGLIEAVASLGAVPTSKAQTQSALTGLNQDAPLDCARKELTYKAIVDLETDNALAKLNTAINSAGFCDIKFQVVTDVPCFDDTNVKKYKPYYAGLLYPRTLAVQLDLLRQKKDGVHRVEKSFFAEIIDPTTLGVVAVQNGVFSDHDTEFEFKDGLLQRYKRVDANEAVGFLAMFPKAAKAIISIPTEILQLKVDYSSTEEGYYAAQQAALSARLAYESALAQQQAEATD